MNWGFIAGIPSLLRIPVSLDAPDIVTLVIDCGSCWRDASAEQLDPAGSKCCPTS